MNGVLAMVIEGPAEDIAAQFLLDPSEAFVLATSQYRMMQRDISAERSDKVVSGKRHRRDAFRTELRARVDELLKSVAQESVDVQPWLADYLRKVASARDGASPLLEAAPLTCCSHIDRRSRALLLLIDLYGFEPWDKAAWVKGQRRTSLQELAQLFPSLRPEDLDSVSREYAAVVRALKRKNVKWGKVIAIGVVGLGLGVVTAGLAAPIIGGLIGAGMGLSGIAATSAGLAALGGGSLAVGGMGMAGGTALIAGVGGVAGAGAAAGAGRLSGWTAGEIVSDVIKLEVVTRLIIIDEQDDVELARKVVEGLHVRIRDIRARTDELAVKLAEARSALRASQGELAGAKDRIRQLEEQLDHATLAGQAVQLVADRLADAA